MATPVWAAGANTGPGSVTQWDGSLQWMNDETPTPGELEGADNPMELYGTYERPRRRRLRVPGGRVRRAVVVGLRPLDHHARRAHPEREPVPAERGRSG